MTKGSRAIESSAASVAAGKIKAPTDAAKQQHHQGQSHGDAAGADLSDDAIVGRN